MNKAGDNNKYISCQAEKLIGESLLTHKKKNTKVRLFTAFNNNSCNSKEKIRRVNSGEKRKEENERDEDKNNIAKKRLKRNKIMRKKKAIKNEEKN